MSSINLIAQIDTTPASHTRAVELLQEYAATVRAEPGNERFELYESADEHGGSSIVVIERYTDQSAFDAHLGATANAEVNAALAGVLDGGGSHLQMLTALPGDRS